MADDPFLDNDPAPEDVAAADTLDADLAERFRSLQELTPPDTWARTTGSDADTASGTFGERRTALLIAAAVILAAGVSALQLGSTSTTPVEVANPPDTTDAPVETEPNRPTIEPAGRPPVKLTTTDGVTVIDLQLEDGSRFRVSLPAFLVTDLRVIESDDVEPIRLSGPDADIEIAFGFCPDEDGMTINGQGSAVSRSGDVVRLCRADEVLSTTVTSSMEITDDELDAFDVRPISVAGAYKAALTEVWPDLANCGNCARWGPMVYPEVNIVVHRTGATSVTAVRLDTLESVWTKDTGGFDTYLHGGPGLVYLEVTGGPLLALDPATGDERWSIERDPGERDLGLDVFGEGIALVRTSFSGEGDDRAPLLRSLDPESGEMIWTTEGRSGTIWQWTRPVAIDGLVILGDASNTNVPGIAPTLLWAVDIDTGETVWTTAITNVASNFAGSDLTILDFENGPAVLTRTVDGDVARIDPRTGAILWRATSLRAEFNGTEFSADGRLAVDLSTPGGQRLLDPETGAELAPVDDRVAAACPVTVPGRTVFTPPAPWPANPAANGMAWYGTNDLWTVIDRSGHVPRKSVWWSSDFPGGAEEEQPELRVVYQRLGADEPPTVFEAPGTNASTPEDGDFMINGVEPDETGCWLAVATYKGASLSYVYEVD